MDDAETRPPVTPVALGVFSLFAATMAALSSVTLLAPGTPLDAMWRIKPAAHAQLLAMGPVVGVGFALLCGAALATSVGTFGRRRWGWWAAVVGVCANATGDAINALAGSWAEGLVGVSITAAIVWWLTRPSVRALFRR
jgi:hypothetical protein